MNPNTGRFQREFGTLRIMTRIYCLAFHSSEVKPCAECTAFLNYAQDRIEHCTFGPGGNDKPACADCPVHCYKAQQREQARTIMRYAGPKMLTRHPLLTVLHFWDKFLSKSRVEKWRREREARRAKPGA